MEDDITQLLSSLTKYPNFMAIHFTNNAELLQKISKICKDSDMCAEYRVFTLNQDDEKKLKIYEDEIVKVSYPNPKRPKFHSPSKSYDFLFIETLPSDEISFLKKIYSALKNAAPVFIFVDSKSRAYEVEQNLIESNYVATNIMNLDGKIVVSGKKMHGWSGS